MKNISSQLLILVLLASAAHAQATRTWVSGVGDDTNPGSRTAPCKTFAGVFGKTAAKGEIDALDPGDFAQVTVTNSITMDGAGVIAGIQALNAGENGIVVQAGATDVVTLRRLTLQGSRVGDAGIRILGGGTVIIEDCYLSGWTTAIDVDQTAACNVTIRGCRIDGGTTGVKVSMTGAGSRASIDRTRITHTTNAVDLLAGTCDVSGSLVSMSSGSGLLAEGGTLNSFNNVLAGNGQDVRFTAGVVRTFNNSGPVSLSLAQDTTVSNVSPGQPAVFNLTLSPPPGGFPATVNFSSVGLPSGFTCSFNPSSLPAGSGTSTVQMTVSPPQTKESVLPVPVGPLPLLPGLAAALVVLSMSGRRRLATALPSVALVVLLLTSGCGGSGTSSTVASGEQVAVQPSIAPSPSATPSTSPSASPSPTVSPSPTASPSPSPSPLTGQFPFTVTATSGTFSVSQTYSVQLR